jgi:hypothetical protein
MTSAQETSYIFRELLALSERNLERQQNLNMRLFRELTETKEIINTDKPAVLGERISALEARENLIKFRLAYLQKLLKDF